MSNTGIIYGVNGPVIYLKGDSGFKISEMVYVGPEHLVGEIIGLKKGMTTVQVFEETTGLKPGDTVTGTGDAISVLLGPASDSESPVCHPQLPAYSRQKYLPALSSYRAYL